jgi:hypothetical protein
MRPLAPVLVAGSIGTPARDYAVRPSRLAQGQDNGPARNQSRALAPCSRHLAIAKKVDGHPGCGTPGMRLAARQDKSTDSLCPARRMEARKRLLLRQLERWRRQFLTLASIAICCEDRQHDLTIGNVVIDSFDG